MYFWKTREVECCFQGYVLSIWFIPVNYAHRVKGMFVRLLHCKMSHFPHSVHCSMEGSHNYGVGVMLHFTEGRIALEFLCKGDLFFSPIHSIIYLYHYRLKDVQHYFILLLKLFQCWPLKNLSVGSCVLLIYSHSRVCVLALLKTEC